MVTMDSPYPCSAREHCIGAELAEQAGATTDLPRPGRDSKRNRVARSQPGQQVEAAVEQLVAVLVLLLFFGRFRSPERQLRPTPR